MRQPPLSPQINIEEHQTHIFNTDWGEGYLVPTLHPKMIVKNFKESTVQYSLRKQGLNQFYLNIYVHDCILL